MGKIKKCDCGKGAKWLYMPGFSDDSNPFVCDDCVARGCSCNYRSPKHLNIEDGIEGKDWKWVVKDDYWTSLDSEGREWPCAEFEYDTDEDNFKTL